MASTLRRSAIAPAANMAARSLPSMRCLPACVPASLLVSFMICAIVIYYDGAAWNIHASQVPQVYSILERRSNRLWQSVKFAARPVCPVTTSATRSGVPTPDGLRTSIRRPSTRTDRRADSTSARAASGRSTSPRSSQTWRTDDRWGIPGILVGSRYAAAVSRLVPMDMR